MRGDDRSSGKFKTRAEAARLHGPVLPNTLEKFASKLVADRLADEELKLDDEKIALLKLDDALVEEAAKVVAVDGFVFNPTAENIDPIEANVRELLTFIGVEAKAASAPGTHAVVKVSGKTTDFDDETRKVTSWLFVNRKTSQYVWFYAREGST